ncbi:MAG TPA: nuclear transport factor 2 family protein [Solirubrobacteraceae bacterium]|nr:nuclear transport factor 2 family protein [Solirubrobacteraceae bacterium]
MATNVETVEKIYAAFGRGDLRTVLDAFDPEIAWIAPPTLPWSRGEYRTPAEVREYFASFGAALEAPHFSFDELIEAGDRVVAIGHENARARPTDRHFSMRVAHIWTIREGRAVRMEGIPDSATVVEAFETRRAPVA